MVCSTEILRSAKAQQGADDYVFAPLSRICRCIKAALVGGFILLGAGLHGQVKLPYSTDFESSEGFSSGNLHKQGGWLVDKGSAIITGQDAHSGVQSIRIDNRAPSTRIRLPLSYPADRDVYYFDFYLKPSASPQADGQSFVEVAGAQIGFFQQDGDGQFFAYHGDGQGGGSWISSGVSTSLNGQGLSTRWVRLTVRLDFSTSGFAYWDLYVDAALSVANLGLTDSTATAPVDFIALGLTQGGSYLDDILFTQENPVFADADNDGMADSYEREHGLDLSVDDRADYLDGDGLANIEEFVYQTDADRVDTDRDGLSDKAEVDFGTDPLDYYNSILPTLTILEGADQRGLAGAFLPLPLTVLVVDSSGNPLVGAPLRFSVSSGSALLYENPNWPVSVTSDLRTDTRGQARVYISLPASNGRSEIVVQDSSTSGRVSVSTTAKAATISLPRQGDLILWLRADAGVTETSGAVSQWTDQSTFDNDAGQSDVAARPTLSDRVLFGQRAVAFDGSDDFLVLPPGSGSNDSFTDFTSGFSGFVVARPQSYEAGARLFNLSRGGSSHVVALGLHKLFDYTEFSLDVEYLVDNPDASPQRPAAINALREGAAHVLGVVHDPTTGDLGDATVYSDGYARVTESIDLPAQPADHRTVNYLGKSSLSSQPYYHGLLGELIAYRVSLNEKKRRKVEIYLSRKYGVSIAVTEPRLRPASGWSDAQRIRVRLEAAEVLPGNLSQYLRFTTDGSDPVWTSRGFHASSGSFVITRSATVRARLFLDPDSFSEVVEAVYYVNDADRDGMDDDWERANGLDPKDSNDAAEDGDEDGLSNLEEFILGSDPNLLDTNGDGLSDYLARRLGLSLISTDTDGDGLSNAVEIARGASPLLADTDGDGTADGADAYPLDPTADTTPEADPSDRTPPTIALETPAHAVPL